MEDRQQEIEKWSFFVGDVQVVFFGKWFCDGFGVEDFGGFLRVVSF